MKRNARRLWSLGLLVEVQELFDKHEYDEANEKLAELRRRDPDALKSPYVAYLQAICCDYREEFEEAMSHIEEGLRADPLSIPMNRSFDIITDRIRKALASESRSPADASTPRLYALLVRSAEADVGSHLAMARHHAHAGNTAAAMRLVDAVTTLEPTNAKAWTMLLELATAAGEAERAEEARAQLAALSTEEPPLFAIPGKAES